MKNERLHSRIRLIRRKPENFIKKDESIFQHELDRELEEVSLFKLADSIIIHNSIYNRQQSWLYHLTHVRSPSKSNQIIYNTIKSLHFIPKKFHQPCVWITDNWSHQYFHWVLDSLPRLFGREQEFLSGIILLPHALKSFPFIRESLELLKFNHLFLPLFRPYHCSNLTIPDKTRPSGNFRPHVLQRLRSKLRIPERAGDKYIFISRQKSVKRRLNNFTAIQEKLKEINFEIHYMEDYTFFEQVELMKSAKVVCGLHGAGLANMLFAPNSSILLELRPENNRKDNCYFNLTNALGQKYYYASVREVKSDGKEKRYEIDGQILIQLLQQIADES